MHWYGLCEYFSTIKARDIAFLMNREPAAPGTGINKRHFQALI